MFEHRTQPLIPLAKFRRRLVKFFLIAMAFVVVALMIGILGYHYLGGLHWLDALVNASMILGGMGPVNPIDTVAGKIFASFYALFSGMIFLVAVGILFAPVLHRLFHHFHADVEDVEGEEKGEGEQ